MDNKHNIVNVEVKRAANCGVPSNKQTYLKAWSVMTCDSVVKSGYILSTFE